MKERKECLRNGIASSKISKLTIKIEVSYHQEEKEVDRDIKTDPVWSLSQSLTE